MSTTPSLENIDTRGRNALITYLGGRKDKSFWGFLCQCREEIVALAMLSSFKSSEDLNKFWVRKFSKEAEELEPDNFSDLNEKVHFYFTKIG